MSSEKSTVATVVTSQYRAAGKEVSGGVGGHPRGLAVGKGVHKERRKDILAPEGCEIREWVEATFPMKYVSGERSAGGDVSS